MREKFFKNFFTQTEDNHLNFIFIYVFVSFHFAAIFYFHLNFFSSSSLTKTNKKVMRGSFHAVIIRRASTTTTSRRKSYTGHAPVQSLSDYYRTILFLLHSNITNKISENEGKFSKIYAKYTLKEIGITSYIM